MVELQIIKKGSSCLFSFCQHVKIIMTDLESKQQFLVSYHHDSNHKKRKVANYQIQSSTCCRGVLVLRSDRDLNEFIRIYKKRFLPQQFDIFSHNCSDAALFTLDYFCPNPNREEKQISKCKDICCCIMSGLTCCSTCTSSTYINTPSKFFAEAEKRVAAYGLATIKTPLMSSSAPICQSMS